MLFIKSVFAKWNLKYKLCLTLCPRVCLIFLCLTFFYMFLYLKHIIVALEVNNKVKIKKDEFVVVSSLQNISMQKHVEFIKKCQKSLRKSLTMNPMRRKNNLRVLLTVNWLSSSSSSVLV